MGKQVVVWILVVLFPICIWFTFIAVGYWWIVPAVCSVLCLATIAVMVWHCDKEVKGGAVRMERREKLARIIHSEFPASFRVNVGSRDKLLRTATFDEESELSRSKYYRAADRIGRYLDKGLMVIPEDVSEGCPPYPGMELERREH